MYGVATDNQYPYRVYGAQQDWSTVCIPSREWMGARSTAQMMDLGYSESGITQVHPTDPNILFTGDHHWLLKIDKRTRHANYISVSDELHYGWGNRDIPLRFAWTFPVLQSEHDNKTLLIGSQFVHRTRDEGRTWEVISPDLTRADPGTLEPTPIKGQPVPGTPPHWGPLTRDSNGDQWYASLVTLAESSENRETIWTGSDDGLVHVTRDGGTSWQNVTPKQIPPFSLINRIDGSSHDPATAYVAATRYRGDDFRPYLLKTNDFGTTWNRIDQTLPQDSFCRVIRHDPVVTGMLYCGTETGVHVSFDDGKQWHTLQNDLPRVPVHDMEVKGNELVIATHGRGFWILNGLELLRHVARERDVTEPTLVAPAKTVMSIGTLATPGLRQGTSFYFWLPQMPQIASELTITDANDANVRTWKWLPHGGADGNQRLTRGWNVFTWDHRSEDEVPLPGAVLRVDPKIGPRVPPGTYAVEFVVDGVKRRRTLELLQDPRSRATPDALVDKYEFQVRIRDKLTMVNELIIDLRAFRDRVTAPALTQELTDIEEQLIQFRAVVAKHLHSNPIKLVNKLYVLADRVSHSDDRPTVAQTRLFEQLSAAADQQMQKYTKLRESQE